MALDVAHNPNRYNTWENLDPVVFDSIQRHDREVFKKQLAVIANRRINIKQFNKWADKFPDRWVMMMANLARLSGYSDKVELEINGTIHHVMMLPDATLELRIGELHSKLILARDDMIEGKAIEVGEQSVNQPTDSLYTDDMLATEASPSSDLATSTIDQALGVGGSDEGLAAGVVTRNLTRDTPQANSYKPRHTNEAEDAQAEAGTSKEAAMAAKIVKLKTALKKARARVKAVKAKAKKKPRTR